MAARAAIPDLFSAGDVPAGLCTVMFHRSRKRVGRALPARPATGFGAASFALAVFAPLAWACVACAADMNLGSGDCAAAGSATAAINNACLSNTGVITLV